MTKDLVDKKRSIGKVTGEMFVGYVEGRVAIVLDDMIRAGVTMTRAAQACRRHGASRVIAIATQGLFIGGAEALLGSDSIDEICVTDSLPAPAAVPVVNLIRPGPRHTTHAFL